MNSFSWWRSWHGAPTDHKWAVIAARSGVKPGVVSAIAWALLDYASQQKERGSVAGFDTEEYAVYSGFSETEVIAVIKAMTDKGIIENNRFAKWGERQPKREDDSAERVARHREMKRNVTQCNADTENVSIDSVSVSESLSESEVTDSSLDSSGEWLDEDSAIQKLSRQFEVSAQMQPRDPERWIQACQDMFHGGVTPDLLGHVVFEMRNPPKGHKKLTVTGPWSCVNIAIGKAAELRAAGGVVPTSAQVDQGGAFYG